MTPRIKYLLCTIILAVVYTTLMIWCDMTDKSEVLITCLYLWSFVGSIPFCVKNYDKFMYINTYKEHKDEDK